MSSKKLMSSWRCDGWTLKRGENPSKAEGMVLLAWALAVCSGVLLYLFILHAVEAKHQHLTTGHTSNVLACTNGSCWYSWITPNNSIWKQTTASGNKHVLMAYTQGRQFEGEVVTQLSDFLTLRRCALHFTILQSESLIGRFNRTLLSTLVTC